MSDSDYAYECMRADLLGLPKPDRDSIPSTSNAPGDDTNTDLTMAEGDQAKVAAEEAEALNDEQMKGLRGGLDEMHNILSITQKKLNNLKCGIGNVGSSFSSSISGSLSGFTGFIKQRVGGGDVPAGGSETSETEPEAEELSQSAPINSVDKLDTMLERAESAEMKLSAQNKQIRQMINK